MAALKKGFYWSAVAFKRYGTIVNWAVTLATAAASCYSLIHCGGLNFNPL
jgi:hypothetical protein